MKKSLISTLALGIIIGTGIAGAKSFADEVSVQQNPRFEVLNQETNQFEKLDDNEYRENRGNYGSCCSSMNTQGRDFK